MLGALLFRYHLNPRPLEVMWLLAQGLNKWKIAQELSLSIRTVEDHIDDLNHSLGTGDLVELLGRWISLSYEAVDALGLYLPAHHLDAHGYPETKIAHATEKKT